MLKARCGALAGECCLRRPQRLGHDLTLSPGRYGIGWQQSPLRGPSGPVTGARSPDWTGPSALRRLRTAGVVSPLAGRRRRTDLGPAPQAAHIDARHSPSPGALPSGPAGSVETGPSVPSARNLWAPRHLPEHIACLPTLDPVEHQHTRRRCPRGGLRRRSDASVSRAAPQRPGRHSDAGRNASRARCAYRSRTCGCGVRPPRDGHRALRPAGRRRDGPGGIPR